MARQAFPYRNETYPILIKDEWLIECVGLKGFSHELWKFKLAKCLHMWLFCCCSYWGIKYVHDSNLSSSVAVFMVNLTPLAKSATKLIENDVVEFGS